MLPDSEPERFRKARPGAVKFNARLYPIPAMELYGDFSLAHDVLSVFLPLGLGQVVHIIDTSSWSMSHKQKAFAGVIPIQNYPYQWIDYQKMSTNTFEAQQCYNHHNYHIHVCSEQSKCSSVCKYWYCTGVCEYWGSVCHKW